MRKMSAKRPAIGLLARCGELVFGKTTAQTDLGSRSKDPIFKAPVADSLAGTTAAVRPEALADTISNGQSEHDLVAQDALARGSTARPSAPASIAAPHHSSRLRVVDPLDGQPRIEPIIGEAGQPQTTAPSSPAGKQDKNADAIVEEAELAWRRAERDARRAARISAAGASSEIEAENRIAAAHQNVERVWSQAEMRHAPALRQLQDRGPPEILPAESRITTARRRAETALRRAGVEVRRRLPAVARTPAAEPRVKPVVEEAPSLLQPALDQPLPERKRRKGIGGGTLSFLLAVVLPVMLVAFYYGFLASDQYRSEMRFAVRGTERSSLENLGLSALTGSSSQASDAYLVIDYIHSKQLLLDIQQKLDIDIRQFYARPEIDFAYRIDPAMPMETFLEYWRWMIEASYNSTTSITTFNVTAFNGADAEVIADAVLKASDELVNDLAAKARLQLISNAQREVGRTETRLIEARQAVEAFRDREQLANPTMVAESDQTILQELERKLIELKARRASLRLTVDGDAPQARVLDRQIAATTAELDEKRRGIGSGGGQNGVDGEGRTLTTQFTEYNGLMLEQEFAEKAYTAALSSLETSQAEARRQDRYFAIAVKPDLPEIALYPSRLLNTIIVFFALSVLWLVGYLVTQAARDHTG